MRNLRKVKGLGNTRPNYLTQDFRQGYGGGDYVIQSWIAVSVRTNPTAVERIHRQIEPELKEIRSHDGDLLQRALVQQVAALRVMKSIAVESLASSHDQPADIVEYWLRMQQRSHAQLKGALEDRVLYEFATDVLSKIDRIDRNERESVATCN